MVTSDSHAAKPLVGRDRELALLELMLDGVGRGQSGAVCITGEPGIGKTSLTAAVLERAAAHGYVSASGRAAEFETDVPFAVLVEALDPHLDAASVAELGLSDAELRLIATVFPAPGSGDAPEPSALGSDEPHHVRRAL